MRAAVAVALVALLAASCSAPSPSPTPIPSGPPATAGVADGGEIVWGVVLPAPTTTDDVFTAAYRLAVDEALDRVDRRVDDVRMVRPDARPFRRDLLEFLAAEGLPYVCGMGAGAAVDVAAVARDMPQTSFCSVGDRVDDPLGNVLAIDVRIEEAAYLAGVAAATAVVAAAAPGLPAVGTTLGFVGGRPTVHTEGQRAAFADGVRRILPDARITAEFAGNVAADERRDVVAGLVAGQYLGGVEAVYVASDVDASRAVEVAREAERPIVGLAPALAAALTQDDPPPVLFTARPVFGPALVVALVGFLDGFEGGSTSLGLAEEVIALIPGRADLYADVARVVDNVADSMRAGDLVIQRG